MNVQGIRLLFSHRPKFGHDADINIHGHQHNLSVLDSTRLYLPLSIEHMGYVPLALDDSFIAKIKPFVNEKRQPTVNELMSLFQNAIGKAGPKDLYDGFGKEAQIESRKRLLECYELFRQSPYAETMGKNHLWDLARQFIENRMTQSQFLQAAKRFASQK